jgi:hypothetical protein
MNKILYTVEKNVIRLQNNRLNMFIRQANEAKQLSEAYRYLCTAKGMFYALHSLGLLENGSNASEEIDRLENKINYQLEERKRATQDRHPVRLIENNIN